MAGTESERYKPVEYEWKPDQIDGDTLFGYSEEQVQDSLEAHMERKVEAAAMDDADETKREMLANIALEDLDAKRTFEYQVLRSIESFEKAAEKSERDAEREREREGEIPEPHLRGRSGRLRVVLQGLTRNASGRARRSRVARARACAMGRSRYPRLHAPLRMVRARPPTQKDARSPRQPVSVVYKQGQRAALPKLLLSLLIVWKSVRTTDLQRATVLAIRSGRADFGKRSAH